jgi:hypothetical protein
MTTDGLEMIDQSVASHPAASPLLDQQPVGVVLELHAR